MIPVGLQKFYKMAYGDIFENLEFKKRQSL